MPVLRVEDRHPLAAAAAVEGAFEVVVVLLRAYPGLGVGAEHGLDSVPALGLDEPFVCAVVADAPVDDITLVVGVLQHAVHAGQSEGTRGAFRAWHAA